MSQHNANIDAYLAACRVHQKRPSKRNALRCSKRAADMVKSAPSVGYESLITSWLDIASEYDTGKRVEWSECDASI